MWCECEVCLGVCVCGVFRSVCGVCLECVKCVCVVCLGVLCGGVFWSVLSVCGVFWSG